MKNLLRLIQNLQIPLLKKTRKSPDLKHFWSPQKQQKGILDIGIKGAVRSFREKKSDDGVAINAGFMVLQPEIFDYLDGDDTIFEATPLERLADEGQLMSFRHSGFWQCMDSLREKNLLENLWNSGEAPWKNW